MMKLTNVQAGILVALGFLAYSNVSTLAKPQENLQVTMSRLDFGKQGSNKGKAVLFRLADEAGDSWEDAVRKCPGRMEWDDNLKTCFKQL